jgi:hypothetical protein
VSPDSQTNVTKFSKDFIYFCNLLMTISSISVCAFSERANNGEEKNVQDNIDCFHASIGFAIRRRRHPFEQSRHKQESGQSGPKRDASGDDCGRRKRDHGHRPESAEWK